MDQGDDEVRSLAAAALAYRDSSAVIMQKHRDQASAVLDSLFHAGYVIMPPNWTENVKCTSCGWHTWRVVDGVWTCICGKPMNNDR